jgi:hypothetical protein
LYAFRRLSATTELSDIPSNKFRAEPRERLPLAYHYHESQQEAFCILRGTLSVETGGLHTVDTESQRRAHNPLVMPRGM